MCHQMNKNILQYLRYVRARAALRNIITNTGLIKSRTWALSQNDKLWISSILKTLVSDGDAHRQMTSSHPAQAARQPSASHWCDH